MPESNIHLISSLTRNEELKLLDDEIMKCDSQESRVRQIKFRRNELLPVSQLPPEVLSSIFIYHRRNSLGSFGSKWDCLESSWIKITYVCRHWRNVALACSSLWAVIFLRIPRLAREMVERSGNARLIVYAELDLCMTENMAAAARVVLGELPRIEELYIMAPTAIITLLYESIPLVAHSLKTLEMTSFRTPFPQSSARAIVPEYLPSENTMAIPLIRFSATDFKIIPNSPFLLCIEKLTHLCLSCLHNRYTPLEILRLLEQLPNIESIQLSNCFRAWGEVIQLGDHDSLRTPRVKLEKLVKFRVENDAESCAALLRIVPIPPTTKVEIVFHLQNQIHARNLFCQVAESVSREVFFRTLRITFGSAITFHLYKDGGVSITAKDDQRFSCVAISISMDAHETVPTITLFSDVIPLDRLQSFEVDTGKYGSRYERRARILVALFHRIPTVTCIDVWGEAALPLVEALLLAEEDANGSAVPSNPIPMVRYLPQLQSLTLRETSARSLIQDLQDLLRIRYESGHKLDWLRFNACRNTFRENEFEFFKKFVGSGVEWY